MKASKTLSEKKILHCQTIPKKMRFGFSNFSPIPTLDPLANGGPQGGSPAVTKNISSLRDDLRRASFAAASAWGRDSGPGWEGRAACTAAAQPPPNGTGGPPAMFGAEGKMDCIFLENHFQKKAAASHLPPCKQCITAPRNMQQKGGENMQVECKIVWDLPGHIPAEKDGNFSPPGKIVSLS